MNPNKKVRALWCVDNESGIEVLIDLDTSKIIARKDDNGNIVEVKDESGH